MQNQQQFLLEGYRGVEISDGSSQFCGKILADLGADLIKIESSDGNPARKFYPFYQDISEPEKSINRLAFNTNKRSMSLDLNTNKDRNIFLKLIKTIDFIIEPGGFLEELDLGYSLISTIKPDIIVTDIFPFSRSGPYAHFKACDIVLMAMGGQMFTCGDIDRPPTRIGVDQAHINAGLHAAIGTLAGLYHRDNGGEGQQVDVSMLEAVVELVTIEMAWWKYAGILFKRCGPCRPRAHLEVRCVWPCKDGHVSFMLVGGGFGRTIKPLVEWMDSHGKAGRLKEIDWNKFGFISLSEEENIRIEKTFKEFFLEHSKEELFDEALKKGFPLAPVNTFQDILDCDQLKSRDFWGAVESPESEEAISVPGLPYKFSETPLILRQCAPLIGEHTREIEEELGLLCKEQQDDSNVKIPATVKQGITGSQKQAPLKGVRVLDFTWVVAGPLIGDYLATFGAEVIKIENSSRPDLSRVSEPYKERIPGLNRSCHFNLWNASKLSLDINLKESKGVDVVKKLVECSDVIIEGFTPGAMKKWSLDYPSLKKLKSDIIMLSVSTQGQTGKIRNASGFGWVTNGLCGFIHASGWPDYDGVSPHVAYTDFIVPWYGTIAILAALNYRKKTGKGQYIDISHLEAGANCMASALIDCAINKRERGRIGNSNLNAAPHGVYPCKGEDRWCAIAVWTEEQWRKFCHAIGNPGMANDSRFANMNSRLINEKPLNELISKWTRDRSPYDVMNKLQKAGIPAGVVQNSRDLWEDAQLKQGDFILEIEHPEIGQYFDMNWPIRFSKSQFEFRHAPLIGEHTEYVCREIIGMSDEEITDLLVSNVIQIS